MKQRVLRNPAAALLGVAAALVVLAVLWVVVIVTAPRPNLPVAAEATTGQGTTPPAPPPVGSHVSTGVLAPDETTPVPAPTTAPATTTAKRGTATCKQAAAGVAAVLGDGDLPAETWAGRLRPYVSEEVAAALPTVDRPSIPSGAATVAHVYEQAGACDVMIGWATNPPVKWLLTVEDHGSGWVVTGWARS